MESALDATNRGFRLLQKMGWKQGTGLGRCEQGIVEPVKMKENLTCLGLGKAEEYDDMTEQATRERRKLETEVVETADETAERLARAEHAQHVQAAVTAALSAFLCRDCNKQYATVREMENHFSSYDHHHRKRLAELMKQQTQLAPHEQLAKRKREQQHETEMLQKRMALAAAAEAAAVATSVAKVSATSISTSATLSTKVGFSFGTKSGGTLGAKAKATKKKPLGAVASVFARPLE